MRRDHGSYSQSIGLITLPFSPESKQKCVGTLREQWKRRCIIVMENVGSFVTLCLVHRWGSEGVLEDDYAARGEYCSGDKVILMAL